MALTTKQDNFCVHIANGKNGIESYMLAYDCNSRTAANVESTKLLKRDDITARINELRKPIINLYQNKAISERQKQIEEIQERIAICKAKEDENSLIRYMDMLNKIYALYKDTEADTKPANPLDTVNNEILQKLIGSA